MSNDPLLLFETSQLFDHDLVSGAKRLIAINEYDPPQLGRRSKCSSQWKNILKLNGAGLHNKENVFQFHMKIKKKETC